LLPVEIRKEKKRKEKYGKKKGTTNNTAAEAEKGRLMDNLRLPFALCCC
jgi:hypothetical protein